MDVKEGDKNWARTQYERMGMSTADIAKAVKRTQTTVIGWAAKDNWQRNRQERADEVRAALVIQEHAEKATRVAIIERVNVEMQAKVLVEHRTDIGAMRSVAAGLWTELKNTSPDLYTLGDRITMLKKLSDASKNVILLERQAFGIQGALEDPTDPNKIETPMDEAASAMGALLGKFASVLGKANQTPSSDIVEMKP